MKKIFLSILVFTLATIAFSVELANVASTKYVFLFIGDGMSIPQRMAADEFVRINTKQGLAINSMPYSAVTTTRAANSFITDSAASGTAIACGEKTNNGAIGLDAEGKRITSIAEVARDSGRKVGIITSVTLNHATPAAFYGHRRSRGSYYEIGLDLVASDFNFFGGSGIAEHDNKKAKKKAYKGDTYKHNESNDFKGDIYDLAGQKGYKIVKGLDALNSLKKGDDKIIACANSSGLDLEIDADPSKNNPTIADFLKKGIELLDNQKGFFIMVEGGMIDWSCHANDAASALHEVKNLDNAVKVALEFAKKHPTETLIVVTGDHETGGLTMGFAGTGYNSYIERLCLQKNSRGKLNSKLRKLGRGNKDVSFDDTKPILEETLGLKFVSEDKKAPMLLTKKEIEELEDAFKVWKKNTQKNEALVSTAIKIANNKAGLAWTSGAHTALPVLTTASGKNAEIFKGTIDNTDIAKILKRAVR